MNKRIIGDEEANNYPYKKGAEIRSKLTTTSPSVIPKMLKANPSASETVLSGSSAHSLQRAYGNRAVVQLIKKRDNNPTASTNSEKALVNISLNELCRLYVTIDDFHFVSDNLAYTKDWIQGAGSILVYTEIERRLDSLVQAGGKHELQQVVRDVAHTPGDLVRRMELGGAALERIPQVVRPGDRFLTEAERIHIASHARFLMGRAYTNFTNACQTLANQIDAEAEDRAAMAALVVGVIASYFAPALGASLAQYAPKLITDNSSPAMVHVNKLLSNKDLVATTFTNLTSATNETMKGEVAAYFRDAGAKGFLAAIRSSQDTLLSTLSRNMPSMSDEQLVTLAAVYESEHTNQEVYVKHIGELLKRFRKEVEPIGNINPTPIGVTHFNVLAWIHGGNDRRLALVSERSALFITEYSFSRFVSPEMHEFALAKWSTPRVLAANQVMGLPADWKSGNASKTTNKQCHE